MSGGSGRGRSPAGTRAGSPTIRPGTPCVCPHPAPGDSAQEMKHSSSGRTSRLPTPTRCRPCPVDRRGWLPRQAARGPRRPGADRHCRSGAVAVLRFVAEGRCVAPGVESPVDAPRCLFPLGLGRQSGAGPLAVGQRPVPTHLGCRMLLKAGLDRVLPILVEEVAVLVFDLGFGAVLATTSTGVSPQGVQKQDYCRQSTK